MLMNVDNGNYNTTALKITRMSLVVWYILLLTFNSMNDVLALNRDGRTWQDMSNPNRPLPVRGP